METNVKVVGFANQSLNGVDIDNKGFDLEYDGKILNLSGFSNDKLYYAKLNNEQISDLLRIPSSSLPLEQRIMYYDTPNRKKQLKSKSKSSKSKSVKQTKRKSKRKSKSISIYKTPRLRSDYKR